ncbi:hypothetical protein M514_06245 [Trichuris suis]|uniref:Galaxin-like repeats domain-containing protein n=1 Tax=Trichuris suis TaxID=68888 RepID=A0A085N2Q7_9BILA|nr:hypothetical protein M513_06245 [Trichuris suis]KFD63753.1 hypothetical protein M514_06245 [Trichuris suis]
MFYLRTCVLRSDTRISLGILTKMNLRILIFTAAFNLYEAFTGSLCGDIFYDNSYWICCQNGELCPKDGTRQCCGRFCYNQSVGICCDDRVRDKCHSEHAACCGHKCYRTDTQMCCNSKIIRRCAGEHSVCCGAACFHALANPCTLNTISD